MLYVAFKRWNYIAATYDYNKRIAKLWVNNKLKQERRVRIRRLSTNYPVRVGAVLIDQKYRQYFKGRISCLKILSVAANKAEIVKNAKACFRGKNTRLLLCIVP